MKVIYLFCICYFAIISQCFCTKYPTQHGRRLSNDICRHVLDVTSKLNKAEKTIIYRCRLGDDCGGVGDRLGGIMGGAFYALQSGRSFRILWPELDHVFQPGLSNWTFDGPTLGIPYKDENGEEIDKTRIDNNLGNLTTLAYPPRKDIALVNDLNSRMLVDPDRIAEIEKFPHFFYMGNRGPMKEQFSAIHSIYEWGQYFPDNDESYAAVYRCVFEGLFRPSEEFLQSEYKSIGHPSVHFLHLLNTMKHPDISTMAFHYRVDDFTAESGSSAELISEEVMDRIISISEKHAVQGKSRILFFVSNSAASMTTVMNNAKMLRSFQAIHCQELSAQIHVNGAVGVKAAADVDVTKSISSTMQAFRDWWIMRQVDVLVLQLSGFSKSAALLAPDAQIRYEDEGLAYRSNYWTMCGGRFC